jgi:hypothetical protein
MLVGRGRFDVAWVWKTSRCDGSSMVAVLFQLRNSLCFICSISGWTLLVYCKFIPAVQTLVRMDMSATSISSLQLFTAASSRPHVVEHEVTKEHCFSWPYLELSALVGIALGREATRECRFAWLHLGLSAYVSIILGKDADMAGISISLAVAEQTITLTLADQSDWLIWTKLCNPSHIATKLCCSGSR